MNFTTWGFKIIGWTYDILTVSIPTAMNKPLSRVFLPTCGALPNDRTAKKKGMKLVWPSAALRNSRFFQKQRGMMIQMLRDDIQCTHRNKELKQCGKKKIQSHYNKLWLP